jgi:hypothetical protein
MVDGGASPKVERNVFTGNHGNFGGAMYVIRSSNPSVVGNLMLDNAAVSQGSAVECNGASPRFYNNTIADNTSLDGALYLTGGSHPMLVNNIIAFNASGLWSDSTSSVAMRDNDVFGNVAFDFTGLSDPTGTSGNIRQDPLFVDRGTANLHLLPASPCVDAGDDTVVTAGQTDMHAVPRKAGAHVDIGAYETQGIAPFTMADATLALKIASGLRAGMPDDLTRLNVESAEASAGTIDLSDGARITRKVAGADPNP